MNARKVSLLALALAALGTLPGPALAQSLSLIQYTNVIEYGPSNAPPTRVEDPLHAEATTTNTYALADLRLGLLRSSASQADQFGVSINATALTQVVFLNSGSYDIAFGAGAVSAAITANFVRSLGIDTAGAATNSFTAALNGVAPGANGSAGASYVYEAANRPGWPIFLFSHGGSFGFESTGSANAAALAVNLKFPAFTLHPGDQLSIGLRMVSDAAAGSPSGLGWSAFTDAAHSAQLSMILPVGVTLSSPQPLAWVAQVPEPGVPVLMALGLAGIVLRLQRRRTVEVQS